MSSRDISLLFFTAGEKEETTNMFVLFQEKAKHYLSPPLCNIMSHLGNCQTAEDFCFVGKIVGRMMAESRRGEIISKCTN